MPAVNIEGGGKLQYNSFSRMEDTQRLKLHYVAATAHQEVFQQQQRSDKNLQEISLLTNGFEILGRHILCKCPNNIAKVLLSPNVKLARAV